MLRKPKPEDLKLTIAINRVLDEMDEYGPTSPEYPKLVANLKELNTLKDNQKSSRRVSPDTLAQVLGTFAGIGLIVSYEHVHVVTSKAIGLLKK